MRIWVLAEPRPADTRGAPAPRPMAALTAAGHRVLLSAWDAASNLTLPSAVVGAADPILGCPWRRQRRRPAGGLRDPSRQPQVPGHEPLAGEVAGSAFGGTAAGPGTLGPARANSPEDAAVALACSTTVVVVPGYALAAAAVQHALLAPIAAPASVRRRRSRCRVRATPGDYPRRRSSGTFAIAARRRTFTSESVSMGHPDKVADRIADAVLDHVLSADARARVACEALVSGHRVILAGEVTAAPPPSPAALRRVVRRVVAAAGYDSWATGFDPGRARVRLYLRRQSPDIARAVGDGSDPGAGDQGMMIGYATRQTPELMPLPLMLAHRLVARQAFARVEGLIPGLRPDAKAQVTVAYEGRRPLAVESLVLSTQHGSQWDERQRDLGREVAAHILRPALGEWWHDGIVVHVNPGGRFSIGGPAADTGLTGRKIIVDTYGGWAPHGGGSFSGKDATKVDRSATYMARHVAKNVVAAGLAEECELHVSYAIGMAAPTSVSVDCADTAVVPEERIEALVREAFPLTPGGIIDYLGLRRPIFEPASYHGHFGRVPGEAGDGTFSWESTHRAAELAAAFGARPTA